MLCFLQNNFNLFTFMRTSVNLKLRELARKNDVDSLEVERIMMTYLQSRHDEVEHIKAAFTSATQVLFDTCKPRERY